MVKFGYDNIRYNKIQIAKTSQRYIDPHVQLKDADIKGNLAFHHGYPVFGLVEFNIWGACNRRCEFCPVADPNVFTNKKEGILVDDYVKILQDLRGINYSGVILRECLLGFVKVLLGIVLFAQSSLHNRDLLASHSSEHGYKTRIGNHLQPVSRFDQKH